MRAVAGLNDVVGQHDVGAAGQEDRGGTCLPGSSHRRSTMVSPFRVTSTTEVPVTAVGPPEIVVTAPGLRTQVLASKPP